MWKCLQNDTQQVAMNNNSVFLFQVPDINV